LKIEDWIYFIDMENLKKSRPVQQWFQVVSSATIVSSRVECCFDLSPVAGVQKTTKEDWKVLTLEYRLILASRVVIESIKSNNGPDRANGSSLRRSEQQQFVGLLQI
jgi:hypothetical protein